MMPSEVLLVAPAVFQIQSAAGDPEYEGTVLVVGRIAAPPQPLSSYPGWFHPGVARRASYVSAAGELAVVGPVGTTQEPSLTTCAEVPSAYHAWSSSFSV